jgi:glycosyltransferase involved in cell wall biosynthesis
LDIPEIIALIPNFRERIATVDIFGLGPDEAKLIQLINELDLQDVISIKGQIEPENSAAVLKNYDFLLLPSYTEGGHPLVMLEAMAVGTIPIVSRLSDVTDNVIISGENGFLAIPVNPKSFAVVMDQAFRSSDLENISTASKDTVAKRFTVQQMVKRYVSLFDYHRTNAVKIKRSQVLELDILGDLPFLPILAIRPIRKMLRILEQKISFVKSETSTLLINK